MTDSAISFPKARASWRTFSPDGNAVLTLQSDGVRVRSEVKNGAMDVTVSGKDKVSGTICQVTFDVATILQYLEQRLAELRFEPVTYEEAGTHFRSEIRLNSSKELPLVTGADVSQKATILSQIKLSQEHEFLSSLDELVENLRAECMNARGRYEKKMNRLK